ncbi:MAG: hypothetical protein ACI4O7_07045, partial [Aristaeellaceae bacterium]
MSGVLLSFSQAGIRQHHKHARHGHAACAIIRAAACEERARRRLSLQQAYRLGADALLAALEGQALGG